MNKKEWTYKGLVLLTDNTLRLIIKTDNNFYRTIPVSSNNHLFEDLNYHNGKIVCVKFFDGTEQISLEKTIENEFEDVILSIETDALIEVNLFDKSESIFDVVKFDFKHMNKIWEIVEEYYQTDIGKERFEDFIEKDVWKKNEE